MSTNLELLEEYNNKTENAISLYNDRGILKKEIRSYEVSLWTLQDDFITVLKWSDVEQKGRIENPKMTLNVDGTLKFNFSIPMYYWHKGKMIENPSWFTWRTEWDGMHENSIATRLLLEMRKIKVIFNKGKLREITSTYNIGASSLFNKYVPFDYEGNVDLYNRKIISALLMRDAGYTNFPTESYATLYGSSNEITRNGKRYIIVYTPITNAGVVRSASWISTYLSNLTASGTAGDWMKRDKTAESIFLKIYGPFDVSEEANMINISDNWAEHLHEIQAEWDQIRYSCDWFGESGIDPSGYFAANFIKTPIKDIIIKNVDTFKDEEVFEFLITNIHENHEGDILTCEVESEGLAFLELGKIGYKLELAQENLEEHIAEWSENGYWTSYTGEHIITEPVESLDYWCQEGCHLVPYPGDDLPISSRTWYYTVQMNYSSHELTIHNRASGKIYEDSYATDWDANGKPEANSIVKYKEKTRVVTGEHSNLYNLTQEIAKQFGVFCQYRYKYDENYHIVGRVIIFYNNFMREDLGVLSFTYPYTASRTGRSIDSTDVTTKLYVLSLEDETTLEGEHTIVNAEPNFSLEDYILNFDYMLETGAIALDQYNLIKPYTIKMREYNLKLKLAQAQLLCWEDHRIKWEAEKTTAENSIKLDKENIALCEAHAAAITAADGEADGYIHKEGANCDSQYIQKHDTGEKYISFTTLNKGILPDSIRIYTKYTNGSPAPLSLLGPLDYILEYDNFNNPSEIKFSNPLVDNQGKDLTMVYLTYKYDPKLYYQNVSKVWAIKLYLDERTLANMLMLLGPKSNNDPEYDKYNGTDVGTKAGITQSNASAAHYDTRSVYKRIKDINTDIKTWMLQKDEIVRDFERAMGLALREGYWLPEDYKDYGEKITVNDKCFLDDDSLNLDTKKGIFMNFDTELFDEEDKSYYLYSATEQKRYYPCIDLLTIFDTIPTNLDLYSLVWKKAGAEAEASTDLSLVHNLGILNVSTGAVFKFVKITRPSNLLRPVLMITGAKSLGDEDIEKLLDPDKGYARLEILEVNTTGATTTINHSNIKTIPLAAWITYDGPPGELISAAYPRIKWSSLELKTDTDSLKITYNGHLLEAYTDYYGNFRNTLRSLAEYPEYYVTIKPEVFYKYGYNLSEPLIVQYVLSNANTAIYLDALKVSEENAKPKVSYEVTISACNTNLMVDLYHLLARIVMINDALLKFENVFGYISQLDLDLDKPWEDTIEVKNYTSKFEDLFSSIVAQTEEMRRTEGAMSAMIAGTTPLSEEGLAKTLTNELLVMLAYLDSYFDSSQVVKDRLTELFTEAGQVLAGANKSLNQMAAITEKNASMLSGFVLNVAAELTSGVYKGPTRPTAFKVGDIWILTASASDDTEIARWMATANADDVSLKNNSSPTAGFVRTSDGTLASITGASLDIDAEKGTIELEALNSISMRSGHEVYIAAGDDVTIIGGDNSGGSINISGGEINICALYKRSVNDITGEVSVSTNENDIVSPKGINLVAGLLTRDNSGNYTGHNAHVFISPYKIAMGASELEMKAASTIKMFASLGDYLNTSAIQIDADNGVWIGAGKTVSLFSGSGLLNASASGASIELSPEHLIMGFMEVNKSNAAGTAIELTKDFLIIAAGSPTEGSQLDPLHDEENANLEITGKLGGLTTTLNAGTSSERTITSLVGAKFTKDSIGFATQTNNTINAIIMNDKGVTIGSDDGGIDLANSTSDLLKTYFNEQNRAHGSYVRVAAEGIELGSLADLYINTDNFKLLTHSRDRGNNLDYTDGDTIMAIGRGLLNILYDTTIDQIREWDKTPGNGVEVRLVLNNDGLYVKGDVYASKFIALDGASIFFAATPTQMGFYSPATTLNGLPIGIFTLGMENGAAVMRAANKLYISSDNLILGGEDFTTLYDDEIIETVTLYKAHTDGASGTPPAYDGTANSNNFYSAPAGNAWTWTKEVPTLTELKPYLWSVIRRTNRRTDYPYYYTNRLVEGLLGQQFTKSYLEYTRVASSVTITYENMNDTVNGTPRFEWTKAIPAVPDTSTTNSPYTGVSVTKYTSTETLVWCRVVKVTSHGEIRDEAPYRDPSLSLLSALMIEAMNIASGAVSVPVVTATGMYIGKDSSGNGVIDISSTGQIKIAGNNGIKITNSAGNDYIGLTSSGIAICSGAELSLASGSTIGINATGNITLTSSGLSLKLNHEHLLCSINNVDTLALSGYGLYFTTELDVYVKNNNGVDTVETARGHSIFHVKCEPVMQGMYYRNLTFKRVPDAHDPNTLNLLTTDIHMYIYEDSLMVRSRTTLNNATTGNITLTAITGLGLILTTGIDSNVVDGQDALGNPVYKYEKMDTSLMRIIASFTSDGCIIPRATLSSVLVVSGWIGGFVVSNGALMKPGNSMGFNPNNESNGIPFYINMPPNTINNNTNDIKLAFWYLNGTVYIRDLVYGTMTLNSALFGTGSSSGTSGDDGGTAVTSGCSSCDDGCLYDCTAACAKSCEGRCLDSCGSGCSGSCQGTSSGGGCFIAGTPINLINGGTIAIEKLTLGTKVESYNPNTQEYSEATVTGLRSYAHRNHIVDIRFTSGDSFTATRTHPILTTSGWKSLDPELTYLESGVKTTILHEGDEVITKHPYPVYVDFIAERNDLRDITVYNFDVEPYNIYLVKDIVVHNAKDTL